MTGGQTVLNSSTLLADAIYAKKGQWRPFRDAISGRNRIIRSFSPLLAIGDSGRGEVVDLETVGGEQMKVLMLGWEFPPFISGGLGTACYGLTRAMSKLGAEITFVLPRPIPTQYSEHVKLASPSSQPRVAGAELLGDEDFSNVIFRTIPSALQPYQNSQTYEQALQGDIPVSQLESIELPGLTPEAMSSDHYGDNLYQEVQRYASLAARVSREEEFDVIHAHDWMTYPAGMTIAKMTGKPLVVHIHSTEFDRSGENVNQVVYDIERAGLHRADQVLAVSSLTRQIVLDRYGVAPEKTSVVYNAIEQNGQAFETGGDVDRDDRVVLFLGRITMQKGPEYFLHAAKRVLDVMEDVKFVMAGNGDMFRGSVELAAELGIGHKVLFTGFLNGDAVDRVFQLADVFVMPSVSEPFGLVPLEALRNDVPVIISKQSGVSEVLTHALKVDFWDVDEMANKIIAVLRHRALQTTLREHGNFEVRTFSWAQAAEQCMDVYESMLMPVG